METVLLLGLGPTALTALDSLAARFRVAGVVRAPALHPGGRRRRAARTLGVRVFDDVRLEGVERAVMKTGPDCVVVSSYDRILPARVLARSRFVNVHYAPLPEYRGRANVELGDHQRRSRDRDHCARLAPGSTPATPLSAARAHRPA